MGGDDLFDGVSGAQPDTEALAEGATLLRGFAAAEAGKLIAALDPITAAAPFRHMVTSRGYPMSVAMTSCGDAGWVSDRRGYRYDRVDPQTGLAWPAMPPPFAELAARAAREAGFGGYAADSCLINRYEPGARMALHQDKDERDFDAPIVSVSLGLKAVFLFGGQKRGDRPRRIALDSGDVVVWGGATRLNFHGIAPVADGDHKLTGRWRINLTFRKAL